MQRKKVIILGAAGRDFHNFNVFFRNKKEFEVVCFTANQIKGISGRKYPKELAGKLYPHGIPIYPEKELKRLIKKYKADCVLISYSDLSNDEVMQKAAKVLSAGAEFSMLGPKQTQIKSKKKIISICAVRTGAGKSPTTRYICNILKNLGKKYVIVRHPMPYGNLKKQAVQRFASYSDLKKNNCTIEEREEYEEYIERGEVVYAGVDYEKILQQAEKEADIIIWDGGNNDFSFFKPDLNIVLTDPHRVGHELHYYPGTTNLMQADIAIISKENTAKKQNIETVRNNIKKVNKKAKIVDAELLITAESNSFSLKGKKILAVEDGPTLTHGNMSYGAAAIYGKKHGAILINPRTHASGSIKELYKKYHHLNNVLPAMGYSQKQVKELETTINTSSAELVLIGTPINLSKLIDIKKPSIRVIYKFQEKGKTLENAVKQLVKTI